jgi:hypothetical protein
MIRKVNGSIKLAGLGMLAILSRETRISCKMLLARSPSEVHGNLRVLRLLPE